MPYQPTYRYALLPDQAYSAYSRPRRDHEGPIYYNAIMKVLLEHPDVHAAAVAAARETGQKLKGLENRDIPPGSRPIL